MDAAINDRGILVDEVLAKQATAMDEKNKERLVEEMQKAHRVWITRTVGPS